MTRVFPADRRDAYHSHPWNPRHGVTEGDKETPLGIRMEGQTVLVRLILSLTGIPG